MTTCGDLRNNQRVPGSLTVTVYAVDENPVSPREVEIGATDANGENLKIVIWKKHAISEELSVGETYRITGGRSKRYGNASGPEVRVHSNDEFEIDRLKTDSDTTRVFVIGDTHVGFRHRSDTNKASWAKDVDNRKTFEQSLARARDLDVDAVFHAGDVFDHNTTQEDRNLVSREIQRTDKAGIPVYFVRGNHDNSVSNRSLSQSPAGHIAGHAALIGQSPVQVLGLDYDAGGFSHQLPYGEIRSTDNPTIILMHDTPYPAVDQEGAPIHRNANSPLDLSGFLDSAEWVDLVVSGHMHVGKRGSIEGYDVPLLITGPTGPISSFEEDSKPSTWLLTISDGEIEVERHLL